MNDRRETLLAKLRGGVWPVLDQQRESERRDRIGRRVLELGLELEQRGAQRRRWAIGVALAACVASAAGLLLFLRAGSSTPVSVASVEARAEVRLVAGHALVQSGPSEVPLGPGVVELASGSLLVTRAEEGAELRLSSDTALSVAPATSLGIGRQGPPDGFEERVRLRTGSVALRVPKLGERRKVSVETGDALIEVHGTQFSVRVVEQAAHVPFTEVRVREGRVLVRSGGQHRFLNAGDEWSSRPAAPPAVSVAPPANAAPPVSVSPPAPKASPRPARPVQSHLASSELAAQNRLLEAAELAQKSGMPSLALQRLDALIARYPDAELAHNARVERFRVLAAMGKRDEAAAAARGYLERHPDGFARDEARRLLEASGSPPHRVEGP